MKHALKHWAYLNKQIKDKTILLFLDFDGTLAPIVSTPARVHLPSQTKKILRQLHSLSNIKLAIISGRNLDDIKKMVAISGIIYAGNHGCQITGPNINWQHLFPIIWIKKLQKLYQELSVAMTGIKGVLIENKNRSVAVHYRNIKNKDMVRFREVLKRISQPYLASSCIKASLGKKVIELGLVTMWNKGEAVNWLIRRLKHSKTIHSYIPIYIGDDVTDETAFTVLKREGITIRVGPRKQSNASYYLRNPLEVATFLNKFLILL
jgi:trehalose 6-phosphate phosphatase